MSENSPDQPGIRPSGIEPFDETLLSAFLDDELAAPERAKVLQRLAIDPKAKATLESLREMRGLVSSLPGWTGPLPSVDYTRPSDFSDQSHEQTSTSHLQPASDIASDPASDLGGELVAGEQTTEGSGVDTWQSDAGQVQGDYSEPLIQSSVSAFSPEETASPVDQGVTNDSEEPVAEEPVAEEPVAEEPVAEEPVAEEPVAEEPVAEEPVAEEPVAEEPVAEEPVAEEPVAEEPVAEEPVAEEPVAEEPVAEEPVAEEPVAEEPVAEEPVAEEPVAEEPVAEEPVAEEPVAEEPVAEEPVAEEPVAEEPVAEEPVAEEPVAEEPVAEEPVAEEPVAPAFTIQHSFTSDSPDVILAMDQPSSEQEPSLSLDTGPLVEPQATAQDNTPTSHGADSKAAEEHLPLAEAGESDDTPQPSPVPLASAQWDEQTEAIATEADVAVGAPVVDTDAEVPAEELTTAEQVESEDMKNQPDASLPDPDEHEHADASQGDFDEVNSLADHDIVAEDIVHEDADMATDDEVEQFIDAHRNAALSSSWNFGTTARVLGLAATLLLAALGGYMFWPSSPAGTLANRSLDTAEAELPSDAGGDDGDLPAPAAAAQPLESEPDSLTQLGNDMSAQDTLQAELNAALGANRSLPSTSPRSQQRRAASPPPVADQGAYAAAPEPQSDAVKEFFSAPPPQNMLALGPPTGGDVSSSLPPTLSDATPLVGGSPPRALAAQTPPSVQPDAATSSDIAMSLPDQNLEKLNSSELNIGEQAPLSMTPDLPAARDTSAPSPAESLPADPAPAAAPAADSSALTELPSVNSLPSVPDLASSDAGSGVPSAQPRARSAPPASEPAASPHRKTAEVRPMLSRQEIDQLLPEPDRRPEGTDKLIDGKQFVFYSDAWQAEELPSAIESIAPLIGYGRPRLPKQIVAPIGSLELQGEDAESVAVEISRALPKAALAQRPPKTNNAEPQMLLAFVSDVEADAVVRALSVQRRQRLSAAWLRPNNTRGSQKAILVLRGLTNSQAQHPTDGQ